MTTAHHTKEDPTIQVPLPQAKSIGETCHLTGSKRQMEFSDRATKKKELSQKWRNAICMASCMPLQCVSPRVKKTIPKQPSWQGWRSEAAMGGSATNIHWLQSAFACYYAHSAFKMFITIQNYLIYFVSFLSVFHSGLQGRESLVCFAYHHSLTSENDAPPIISSTKKTFEQWVGERASEQVYMVSPQLQWDRCISPSLTEGERKAEMSDSPSQSVVSLGLKTRTPDPDSHTA